MFPSIHQVRQQLEAVLDPSHPPTPSEIDDTAKHLSEIVHRAQKDQRVLQDIALRRENRSDLHTIGTLLQQLPPEKFGSLQGMVNELIGKIPAVEEDTKRSFQEFSKSVDEQLALVKNTPKLTEDQVKTLGRLLKNHLDLINTASAQMESQLISEEEQDQLLSKLEELYAIVMARDEPQPAIGQLQKLLHSLFPFPRIWWSMPEITIRIAAFLPADTENLESSLGIIRRIMRHDRSLGLEALANWINDQEICISRLDLTKDELKGIGPWLRYGDFSVYREAEIHDIYLESLSWEYSMSFEGWTENEITKFLNDGCPNLEWLRLEVADITFIKGLASLKELVLYGCKVREISDLKQLEKLEVMECPDLKSIANIDGIQSLRVRDCGNLKSFSNLEKVDFCYLFGCVSITSISGFNRLKALGVRHCDKLESISQVENLESLAIQWCPDLTDISSLNQLKTLGIQDCHRITAVKDFEKLEKLEIERCRNMATLQNLPNLERDGLHYVHSPRPTTSGLPDHIEAFFKRETVL